jgi:hypothetical protein
MRYQNQGSFGAKVVVFTLSWVNTKTLQNVSRLRYILPLNSETLSYSS